MSDHSPGTIVLPVADLLRYSEFAVDMLNLVGGGHAPVGTVTSVHRSGSVVENINMSLMEMIRDQPEHEWAWIMGDDHRFNPEMLIQLLDHEVDVVVPLCIRRNPPFALGLFKGGQDFMDERTGRLYPGYEPFGLSEVPDEIFPVVASGSAGMLIRRNVLDTIGYPYFESSDGVFLNEDLEFCRRCREAGFEIMCDPHSYLGHIGQFTVWPARYEGQLAVRIDHGGPEGKNEVWLGDQAQVVEQQHV
jgi:hypothetical protein